MPRGTDDLCQEIVPSHVSAWRDAGGRCHLYSVEQILFYRAHLPYGVFAVFTGSIRLEYGRSDKMKIVSGRPLLLGLRAILEGRDYPATAVVNDRAWVSFFDRAWIGQWGDRAPSWVRPYVV
mgnify:CR=1 FL=1